MKKTIISSIIVSTLGLSAVAQATDFSCRITEKKGHQSEIYQQVMQPDSGGQSSQFKLKLFPNVRAEIDRMVEGNGDVNFWAGIYSDNIAGAQTNGEHELGTGFGYHYMIFSLKIDNTLDQSVQVSCLDPK